MKLEQEYDGIWTREEEFLYEVSEDSIEIETERKTHELVLKNQRTKKQASDMIKRQKQQARDADKLNFEI